jgi:Sec-independent protein translocase protein TatA
MGEITVILLLALIFLGPKKLPELASGLGKIIRDIRKATNDVKNEIQLDEHIRKPFEELRDAVTLHPDELKRRDRLKKDLEDARRRAEADLAALAANTPNGVADVQGEAQGKTDDQSGDAPAAIAAVLPLPGMPAPVLPPPPFPGAAGSGPHTATAVPPPFHSPGSAPHAAGPLAPATSQGSGSGPHGAVPPPFHLPGPAPTPGSGSGPQAAITASANPPHTVPVSSSRDKSAAKLPGAPRPVRSPVAAAAPVTATKPHAEKTVTTQFLSEADLIPPDAPPPLPPRVPGNTGKHPHTAATPASTAVQGPAATPGELAANATHAAHLDRKDDVKQDGVKKDGVKKDDVS